MLKEILIVIGLTFMPFFELRASIPYGILALGKEYWLLVFILAVASNLLLGLLIYSFLHIIIKHLTRIRLLEKWYKYHVERAQAKIHKGVVKYGIVSLGLFIGIPLPGTGSYSGALVANLLGMNKKEFLLANLIGVLLAGSVITIVMVSGASAWDFMVKK